jgi:dolichol-phosphate mannosyltransferase
VEHFDLDIVVPVYDEGENIVTLIGSLTAHVIKTRYRLLICYDREEDSTLAALARLQQPRPPILLVKNEGIGVLGAIITGLARSTAPVVVTMPADDHYNAPRIDAMTARFNRGVDIVCPSRFVGDGCMVGCPLVKATLVRMTAWFMFHIVGVPTHDATTGFRFFSRRVVEQIPIETKAGFAYSIELLVKCHRLNWRGEESPALWYQRVVGESRFLVFKWAPVYLKWVSYALATRFLRRGPETVVLRKHVANAPKSKGEK